MGIKYTQMPKEHKRMRNNGLRMISTTKKLEKCDENVRESVKTLINQLFLESSKYHDSEDIFIRLLLCEVISILLISSDDKSIVENNVEFILNFFKEEMENAINDKFNV